MALRRLGSSIAAWTFVPPLAVNAIVPALASYDLVYAPLTVTASLTLATVPIGFALGAVRGACSAGETLLVPSVGDFVATSVAGSSDAEKTATQLRSQLQNALRGDSLVGSVLAGSGVTGFLARGAMSMFLPATDVFVERVVSEMNGEGRTADLSALVRASCDGVILGNTTKLRDTANGLGALAYLGVVGVVVAGDRAADTALGGDREREERGRCERDNEQP